MSSSCRPTSYKLKPGCSLRFAIMPKGEDPDSLVKAKGAVAMEEVLSRSMGNGRFSHHGMIGYTSAGAGVSIVPARFNCPPEITLHCLQASGP